MAVGELDFGLFTIVIPTYNEVGNVRNMVEELFRLYPGVKVTVVDDGSKDGTVESILALEHNRLGLRLVQRSPRDRGLTASVVDGIKSVETRSFVVMDCDFQHPPRSARALMQAVDDGADLAIGVREGMGPLRITRKVASSGAHKLASTYLWFKRQPSSRDLMSGFFAGDAKLVKGVIEAHEQRFEKVGFKVLFDILKFVPREAVIQETNYKFEDRASGHSKLSSEVVLSVLRQCGLGGKVASGTLHFFLINKAGRAVGFIILAAIFAIVISFSA